jgi:hypothetical protein
MPGYAWSIPTAFCITGSKLSQIEGTPCSKCYAQKGRYKFPNVYKAMLERFTGWKNDPDWINLMTIRLLWLEEKHFRWFDSGDLQSETMLCDINQIALNTPSIQYWLPTQERNIISTVPNIADNLTIRVSSTKINEVQRNNNFVTSSISTEQGTCPGVGSTCGTCRACWDKQVQNVIYLEHC